MESTSTSITIKPASSVLPVSIQQPTENLGELFERESDLYRKTLPQQYENFKKGEVFAKNKIDDTTTYVNILRYVIDAMFDHIREKINSDKNISVEEKQKNLLKITIIDAVFTSAIKMVDLLEVKLDKYDFIFTLKGFINKSTMTFYKK